jgi:hypothetical protein
MRVLIRPSLAPHLHIDVTRGLTAAIAHELSRVQEGNDVLNWLEAERILGDLLKGQGVSTAGPVQDPKRSAAMEPRETVTARRARRAARRAASSLPRPTDAAEGPAPLSASRG